MIIRGIAPTCSRTKTCLTFIVKCEQEWINDITILQLCDQSYEHYFDITAKNITYSIHVHCQVDM